MSAGVFDLRGKTALVTGASSGLGAHFAGVLASAGANLILAARRVDSLNEVSKTITSTCNVKAEILKLDVTSAESVRTAFNAIAEIDILVNNAGIARTAAALDQNEESWDAVLNTNLKGAFLVAQAAARCMSAAKSPGSIINVASILGIRQSGTVLPYAVSKAGLIQMTKLLALELARFDIRVNALAPGYFDTDINRDFWRSESGKALIRRVPQRRLGQLCDLDGPLLLLASDASRFMTGSVLPVDGGHLVSTL
jgi:NAD(P)-dependent dehydrogenase (short-subunit alcohol dehydrogenase family)